MGSPAASGKAMLDIILSLPEQVRKGREIGRTLKVAPTFPPRVVVCGMGGSAIAGDIVARFGVGRRTPEIAIVRDYHLPSHFTKGDLVVAVSYSGNTEETLSCFGQAKGRGCTLAAVTSGGELAKLCEAGGYPLAELPPGLPPRGAVGYIFSSLAMLLEDFGALSISGDLEALASHLEELREGWGPRGGPDSKPRSLARLLKDRIPVIYSTPGFAPVARRWQTQLNENSKVLAWHGILPEMDHNELVGWSADDRGRSFAALFLKDFQEEESMERRLKATVELMGGRVHVETLAGKGRTTLDRLFHLLYLGDFTSLYLAELRGVDPLPVKVIEELKARLSRQ